MNSAPAMERTQRLDELGEILGPATAKHSPKAERTSVDREGEGNLGGRWTPALALLGGDALACFGAWLSLAPFGSAAPSIPTAFGAASAVALAASATRGLYPGYGLHGYEAVRRRGFALLVVGAPACVAGYFLTGAYAASALLAAFFALTFLAQFAARSGVRLWLRRAGNWGQPVVVVGEPRKSEAVAEYFSRHWQYGLRPIAANDRDRSGTVALVAEQPDQARLVGLRREHSAVIILADLPGLRMTGIRPSDVRGEVGLRLRGDRGGLRLDEALLRALEVAVAGAVLLAALPVLAAAAAAIYFVDPGPVFYRQRRDGLDGRQVEVLKLRTMYRDAGARLDALLASDPAARAEWSSHFKLRSDPRILPGVGHILRRSSLDELPQLLNVLAGQMRLVGPRPLPDYHMEALDRAFQERRRCVKPGLTGLWQITERSAADLARLQELDDFYIENRSFWFDLHILLKTGPAVFKGDGAY